MSTEARSVQAIEALLERERGVFIAQFNAVPAERRRTVPERGGWSAVQVVEHVSRVEFGVAKMIGAGATMPRTATPEELEAAQITERKAQIVRDRTEKVEAPVRTHPQSELDSDAALAQLGQSRAALLAAFRGADAAVLDGITFVHPFIGALTLRAWVELVAHHDARHAEQLAELA